VLLLHTCFKQTLVSSNVGWRCLYVLWSTTKGSVLALRRAITALLRWGWASGVLLSALNSHVSQSPCSKPPLSTGSKSLSVTNPCPYLLIVLLVYEHKSCILVGLQTVVVHMAVIVARTVAVVHMVVIVTHTVAVVHMVVVAAAVVVHILVHNSVVGRVADLETVAPGKALVLDMVTELATEAAVEEVGCSQSVIDMKRAQAIRTWQLGSEEVGGHWGKVAAKNRD
jgi:hypothetical protein